MDRTRLIGTAALAGVLVLVAAWWFSRTVAPPVAQAPPDVRPEPLQVAEPAPEPEVVEAGDDDEVQVAALSLLAELEGAGMVRCPEPPVPIGKGPFLRTVASGVGFLALVADPEGQGLVYGAPPRPARGEDPRAMAARMSQLRGPQVLVRWGQADGLGVGWCRFEPVVSIDVEGVIRDDYGIVSPSWVTGCGAAMVENDPDGRFVVEVPVGEACLLQAEGRGDGVWIMPEEGMAPVDVPWVEPVGDAREEVADRLARAVEALEALDRVEGPLEVALDQSDLDPAVRQTIESWLAETQQEQAGKRAWLERALERYSGPQRELPGIDDDDGPSLEDRGL